MGFPKWICEAMTEEEERYMEQQVHEEELRELRGEKEEDKVQVWKCDLCGRTFKYPWRYKLNEDGAIRRITGAEDVCAECWMKIHKIDWNKVVRERIEAEGK